MITRQNCRKIACEIIFRFGALKYTRIRNQQQPKILIYHSVLPADSSLRRWNSAAITPALFEKQIKYLKSNYRIISLKQVFKAQEADDSKKSICLTFDDGFADNYHYAFPILKNYNVPATIFLCTDTVGTESILCINKIYYLKHKIGAQKLNQLIQQKWYSRSSLNILKVSPGHTPCERVPVYEVNSFLDDLYKKFNIKDWPDNLYLNWKQVAEMAESNIDFGNHTCSHPCLALLNYKEQLNEIATAKKIIIANTPDTNFLAFSYPFGLQKHFNQTTIKIIKETNHPCAVTGYPSQSSIQDDLYMVGRISIPVKDTMGSFACNVESISPRKLISNIFNFNKISTPHLPNKR